LEAARSRRASIGSNAVALGEFNRRPDKDHGDAKKFLESPN
jgi:hypothetical protein